MRAVYVAGPIKGTSYEQATHWRLLAADLLGANVEVLDPMRRSEALAGETSLSGTYADPLWQQKAFVNRDLFDIARADAVLAYLSEATTVSIGTMCEFGYAYALRKPIVTVLNSDIHDHPFVRELSTFLTPEFGEACDFLRALLNV
jgi:nucleoside 2-deoxyribosyltransferase